jgi:hypothetical protein
MTFSIFKASLNLLLGVDMGKKFAEAEEVVVVVVVAVVSELLVLLVLVFEEEEEDDDDEEVFEGWGSSWRC